MILLPPPHVHSILHNAPGTFATLMDLYECNYINMRRLLPVTPQTPVDWVSRIPGSLDLHLRLVERFRYTSELVLTYEFIQNGAKLTEPNLRIRVYHDARLAEVMAAHLRHCPAFDNEAISGQHTNATQLHFRWKVNRFLFKWLSYCLRQGHRFAGPLLQSAYRRLDNPR